MNYSMKLRFIIAAVNKLGIKGSTAVSSLRNVIIHNITQMR